MVGDGLAPRLSAELWLLSACESEVELRRSARSALKFRILLIEKQEMFARIPVTLELSEVPVGVAGDGDGDRDI